MARWESLPVELKWMIFKWLHRLVKREWYERKKYQLPLWKSIHGGDWNTVIGADYWVYNYLCSDGKTTLELIHEKSGMLVPGTTNGLVIAYFEFRMSVDIGHNRVRFKKHFY